MASMLGASDEEVVARVHWLGLHPLPSGLDPLYRAYRSGGFSVLDAHF